MLSKIQSLEREVNGLYRGENLNVKPKNSHNYRKIKSIVSSRRLSLFWKTRLKLI